MAQTGKTGYIKLMSDYGSAYTNGVTAGISHALLSRPQWVTRLHPMYITWDVRSFSWKPDCLIAQMLSQNLIRMFTELEIPAVNISGAVDNVPFPSVLPDDIAIGKMAAEYFLELNLSQFAFWGSHSGAFALRRQQGFVDTLIKAGVPQSNIRSCPHDEFMDIDKLETELRIWLLSLPKPVGILASLDGRAYYLNDIARSVGIDIPNEIALLGVDNEKLLCELSRPSLSSISLPLENIGIKAVEVLEMIMQGQSVPDKILLPPCEVVSRASTEMLAVDDPDMVRAIMYIRSHATEDIKISDLLKRVPVSRRTLENKFKTCFKRTPWAEIRRVRTEHAKRLLTGSDLPMPEIAARSGFNSPEYMSRIFSKYLGLTPSQYRKKHRPHL